MATLCNPLLTSCYPESPARMTFAADPQAFIAQHEEDYKRLRLLGRSPSEIAVAIGPGHPVEAVDLWISELTIELEAGRFHETLAEWDAFVEELLSNLDNVSSA